jgi:hypothetical protein
VIQPLHIPTAHSSNPQLGTLPRARTIRFSTTLAMPIQLQASILISGRSSPSGSRCILDGAAVLAGLSTVLTFSCGAGMRRRGEPRFVSEVMLIPAGDWFVVRGTPFHAPIAMGSPLQIQFRDSGPAPLTEVLSLGRIGARPLNFCVSFRVPVDLAVEITTDDRGFNPGAQAAIDGKLVFPRGIRARCTFRLADGCGEDGHLLVGCEDTIAVEVRQEIRFAKELTLSPAPARPLRSVTFLDGHGYRFAASDPAGSHPARATRAPVPRSVDLELCDSRRVCSEQSF